MPNAGRNYHIRDVLSGQSLAQALKHLLREQSWTQIKKLIAQRHIHVNGNLCTDEGRRIKTGDVIKVFDEALAKPASADELRIHYRDAHLIVVEKPPGVNSLRHAEERDWPARRKAMQPSLDELVNAAIAPKAATSFKAPRGKRHSAKAQASVRVRPVHRLDRDTSGLMIFALSPQAEQELERMFARHTIERVYLAVVYGKLMAPMTIETQFVRDRGDGLRGSLPAGQTRDDAQRAVTHVTPIDSFTSRDGETYSIIQCQLETGRTHQIRIHLAERGHRLCGERTYNKPIDAKPIPDGSGAPRQALHSHRMSFTHPISGQALSFESPLAPDVRKWLDRLQ